MASPEARARFGALLEEYRLLHGLSQNQFARQVGVNPSYVSKLERGLQGGLPTRKVLKKMALVLGLNSAATDQFLHVGGAATEIDWQEAYARLLYTGEETDV